jgi:hypothetical protein
MISRKNEYNLLKETYTLQNFPARSSCPLDRENGNFERVVFKGEIMVDVERLFYCFEGLFVMISPFNKHILKE